MDIPGAWKLVNVLSKSNAMRKATINPEETRYIKKSQAKFVNQNVAGLRPVIICKCFAPLVRSTSGNIKKREISRLIAMDSKEP